MLEHNFVRIEKQATKKTIAGSGIRLTIKKKGSYITISRDVAEFVGLNDFHTAKVLFDYDNSLIGIQLSKTKNVSRQSYPLHKNDDGSYYITASRLVAIALQNGFMSGHWYTYQVAKVSMLTTIIASSFSLSEAEKSALA